MKDLKEAAEQALAAKRRIIGSTQLTGDALELFIQKKPFELEKIISGEIEANIPVQEIFDPTK